MQMQTYACHGGVSADEHGLFSTLELIINTQLFETSVNEGETLKAALSNGLHL